jgi:competence protein ComEC
MVALLRFRDFSMLLTGDAEAELAPVDPGPIDVLKVAHHGSDDAGLPALLEQTQPELALISVGADNDYGHPTADTLAELGESGATVARTDLAGSLTVEAWAGGYRLLTGD